MSKSSKGAENIHGVTTQNKTVLRHFILSRNKILVIWAGIHKMPVRMANCLVCLGLFIRQLMF